MEITSGESSQASFPFQRHEQLSSRLLNIEDNFSSAVDNDFVTNNSLFQRNAQSILQQPISSLRRNRRSTSIRSLNSGADHHHRQANTSNTDILDYIDNIPIKDLEVKLLQRNTGGGSEVMLTSAPPSLIQRPPIQSPSPPKMYRMNMF